MCTLNVALACVTQAAETCWSRPVPSSDSPCHLSALGHDSASVLVAMTAHVLAHMIESD